MLNKIDIKNYRSCLETTLKLHPNLTVLIGPNGSGKTNILQAIMLLAKLAQEELTLKKDTPFEGVNSSISAHFSLESREASFTALMKVYPDDLNRDVISESHQSWKLKARNGRTITSEIPLNLGYRLNDVEYERYVFFLRYRDEKANPKQPEWVLKTINYAATFCRRIRYYGASQFTNPGSCPTSFIINDDGRALRTFSMRGHGAILQKLYAASKASPSEDFEEFLDIAGENGLKLIDDLKFTEIQSSSVDYTVRVGGKLVEKKRNRLLVIPQFKIGKQILSPNQLSEGTFKTLALLFHVITDTSSLLLIEEPEVCVHHGLLSSILEIIKSFSLKKQIVVSTHSDYVLDHVKPENVSQVIRDVQIGTRAQSLTDALNAAEYSALRDYLATSGNLGEYWREGGLGDRT